MPMVTSRKWILFPPGGKLAPRPSDSGMSITARLGRPLGPKTMNKIL